MLPVVRYLLKSACPRECLGRYSQRSGLPWDKITQYPVALPSFIRRPTEECGRRLPHLAAVYLSWIMEDNKSFTQKTRFDRLQRVISAPVPLIMSYPNAISLRYLAWGGILRHFLLIPRAEVATEAVPGLGIGSSQHQTFFYTQLPVSI